MIAFLEGIRRRHRSSSRVVVDVGGVGYLVTVPRSTEMVLPGIGCAVALQIHTEVSDQAISLYGFATCEELLLFETLIDRVKNCGPSTALAVMSTGRSPRDIATMIRSGQADEFKRIKGIGAKTADAICALCSYVGEQIDGGVYG